MPEEVKDILKSHLTVMRDVPDYETGKGFGSARSKESRWKPIVRQRKIGNQNLSPWVALQ